MNQKLKRILALIVMVGLTGCASNDRVRDTHVLLDSSGSLPEGVWERIEDQVMLEAGAWAERAGVGEEWAAWWLLDDGERFPASTWSFTMPVIKTVPAFVERKEVAETFLAEASELLGKVERGLGRTRLLEALFFIASTRTSGGYEVWVYSDLEEDSRRWDAAAAKAKQKDAKGLVEAMLSICHGVEFPPARVVVCSWPGHSGKGESVEVHARNKELFRAFLARWAPGAELEFRALR